MKVFQKQRFSWQPRQTAAREVQGGLTESELGLRKAAPSCMVLLASTLRPGRRAGEGGLGAAEDISVKKRNPSPGAQHVCEAHASDAAQETIHMYAKGSFTSCYTAIRVRSAVPKSQGPWDPSWQRWQRCLLWTVEQVCQGCGATLGAEAEA